AFVGGPVQSATGAIETAVTRSFTSVENTIARAVISGKASMDSLVTSILAGFDRIATTQFIVKPIESVLTSIAGSILPIGGARAAGGPVDAGTPYLVGEQGPELFVPGASGAIAPHAPLPGARATQPLKKDSLSPTQWGRGSGPKNIRQDVFRRPDGEGVLQAPSP